MHPYQRHIRNYRDSYQSSDEKAVIEQFGLRMQANGVCFIGDSLGSLNLATADDIEHFLMVATASLPGG